tara:strand:+ start:3682 stop:6285 length:2604 start_codon:yes stop_codon:yes gene_type:complete
MILAIDGIAASGKSTTAKMVASKLGFTFLDTGAMYRAVTLAILDQSVELNDETALKSLLTDLDLEVKPDKEGTNIFLKGKDVSKKIRSLDVTENVSAVSAIPVVREAMVSIQRTLGSQTDCIVEGRDIGTVVFPDADFKFFIVADVKTRARRRQLDLLTLGEKRSIEELSKDLKTRDQKDSSRSHSPLTKAADAVELDTTHLSIDEQVKFIVEFVKSENDKRKDKMTEKDTKEVEAIDVEPSITAIPQTNIEISDPVGVVENLPSVDYLDPKLFQDTPLVERENLDQETIDVIVPEEIQEQYLSTFKDISEHEMINGRVIGITDNDILVDIGFKSEGIIDRSEFPNDKLPKIGEKIELFLEKLEDKHGHTILSKSKADFMQRWKRLRETFESGATFTGKIMRRTKGGLIVDIGDIEAFLPGSQIDVRPVKDFDQFLDQDMELKIVKFNESRKNIVVSHKAILEEDLKELREDLFKKIKIGGILEGRVKNITDFGVFIDLGGLDGLLHITDLSWGRVMHPSEIVKLDEELTVKIIDYDEEKKRVSLGLKQLTPHPWDGIEKKYPVESIVTGKVVSLTNYGIFIEIEPGIEGLIHISEISWTRHIKNPSELYSMNDEVEAKILSIDMEDRKISLGVKQLQPDPWDTIKEKYAVDAVHKGKVIHLTQFGAFVELEEGIDGLIHISDLSWIKVVRHPKEIVENNQEVEVKILEISKENRRIALGYKQVGDDPWPEILKFFETGKEVQGKIVRILEKGIILELEKDIEGIIPFDRKNKKEQKTMMDKYKPGDTLTGIVMEVKPEEKKVFLYFEKLIDEHKKSSNKDSIHEFMDQQEDLSTEKIKIPPSMENIDEPEKKEKDSEPKESDSDRD